MSTSDKNLNCNSCNSCSSCNSCHFCNFCNFCNSCYSCDSCHSCHSCDFCNFCSSCSSCNSCVGLRMSERMLFCFGDGKYESKGEGYQKNNRIFNTDVNTDVFDTAMGARPAFKLPVATWVDKKDMTDDEKDNNSSYKQTGGYLKRLSYKDAWAEGWTTASTEFKDWVKNLPHFNADIFEKITGLKIGDSLVGQEAMVEIGGKKYKAVIKSEE